MKLKCDCDDVYVHSILEGTRVTFVKRDEKKGVDVFITPGEHTIEIDYVHGCVEECISE